MSEIVESAVPSSTADIAASVIESSEAADASSSDSSRNSGDNLSAEATATETPTKTAELTAEELSDAAKFLMAQGHKFKKDDGRDTWLPVKTVEKMLDRYVSQHRTNWDTRYTTVEGEAKTLKQQVEQLSALGELMERDPRAFLELVSKHDERYKSFLTPAEAARQEAVAANDPMPQPDFPLGDGRMTYSLDGLKELRAWERRDAKREFQTMLDERLKPLTEREKQLEEARKAEQAEHAVRERSRQQIAEAENWPYFGKYDPANLNDVQSAILKEMQADKSISLHSAYMKVVRERFAEDDNKRRERLLKEINAAPKSTAVARTGGEPRKAGPRTTAEIAAAVVQEAEAS